MRSQPERERRLSPETRMTTKQLAKTLKQQFKEIVSGPVEFRGEWTLEVSDASRIAEVCQFAKSKQGFDFSSISPPSTTTRRHLDGRRCITFTASGIPAICD